MANSNTKKSIKGSKKTIKIENCINNEFIVERENRAIEEWKKGRETQIECSAFRCWVIYNNELIDYTPKIIEIIDKEIYYKHGVIQITLGEIEDLIKEKDLIYVTADRGLRGKIYRWGNRQVLGNRYTWDVYAETRGYA